MGAGPLLVAALGVAALGITATGCTRPLGAWFDSDHDGGAPDGWVPPDGGWPDGWVPPDSGIPDGAVNDPPVAICEAERHTAPGREIVLYGGGEDDWGVVGYQWTVTNKPAGSTPELGQPNQPETSFVTDEVGDYTVQLTVRDAGGLTDQCETVVRSRVSVPTALCPADQTTPTRTPLPLHGDAQDDGYIVRWQWEVVSHNTDTPPELVPTTTQDTTFEALRVGQYVLRLTVEDEHGLTDVCQLTVTTTPTGPAALCPTDIQTAPLSSVQWTGDGIDDGQIVSKRWEVVSQPPGSSASPPSPDNQWTASFTPDTVGTYVIRLTVTDDDNNTDQCEFNVEAFGEGLRVYVHWNPPEDPYDSSDVDVHLLHPNAPAWAGGSNSLDCYYANCQVPAVLDWDVQGFVPDNPRLDLDDTSGYGPENINIDEPVVGHTYRVGVHYYSNNNSSTQAAVYVKIYCGEIDLTPVYEVGPFILNGSGSPTSNDFWKVADVTWNGFDCTVNPLGTVVPHWQAEQSR